VRDHVIEHILDAFAASYLFFMTFKIPQKGASRSAIRGAPEGCRGRIHQRKAAWDEDEEGAMTGAMRDALELIRSLKKQYPDETEDQLVSRFQKELEADRALKRAVMRDVFNDLLQELDEGKPPNSKV
jgi:hypothetical protein